VLDRSDGPGRPDRPAGRIVTEADIAQAVAGGKDVNSTRIHALMTARPTVINATTGVRDAAKVAHLQAVPGQVARGPDRQVRPPGLRLLIYSWVVTALTSV
jgi:hypothetical protein